MRVLTYPFWALVAFALPRAAHGQIREAADRYENLSQSQLVDILLSFAQWALGLLGVVAVIVTLWAAFQFMTAGGGSEERVEKAKKTLIWALVGVLVAILSFSIVTFTKSLLDDSSPQQQFDFRNVYHNQQFAPTVEVGYNYYKI